MIPDAYYNPAAIEAFVAGLDPIARQPLELPAWFRPKSPVFKIPPSPAPHPALPAA